VRADRTGRRWGGPSRLRIGRPARGSVPASRSRRASLRGGADRCSHRHAWPDPPDREVLGREARRRPVLPELLRALLCRASGLTRLRDSGDVALDVGGHHRHPRRRELLGEKLERPRLSGSGRSGDQAVPVGGCEWKPDCGLLDHLAFMDAPPEIERAALEGVGLPDRRSELRHEAGKLHRVAATLGGRAPVAQGIERCPAEAEVARSNRAGRTLRITCIRPAQKT
jgi:hypothetical protein